MKILGMGKKIHVKDLKSLKSLGNWYCGVYCEIFHNRNWCPFVL